MAVCLAQLLVSHRAYADDTSDARRIASAVGHLRDTVLDKCALTLSMAGTSWSGDKVATNTSGTLIFARFGTCVLTDANTSTSIPNHKPATYSIQLYLDSGQRSLGGLYQAQKGVKKFKSLSIEPKNKYDQDLFDALSQIHIESCLSRFGNTDSSLSQITELPPAEIIRGDNGSLEGRYSTPYGRVVLRTANRSGRDVLVSARLMQSASDWCTPHWKRPLSTLPESVVGVHPAGLMSIESGLAVEYTSVTTQFPFTKIRIEDEWKDASRRWRSVKQLTPTAYRRLADGREIEALRIPIPEGQRVHSLDPEYKPLNLAYAGGQIVRQVDGASLDQVVAETTRRPFRALWLIAAVGLVAVVAAGGIWLRRRAIRTRTGG